MTTTDVQELKDFLLAEFAKVHRRLDEHDRRFDAIEERLDEHDRRFDAIDERLDGHDREFLSIRGEFEHLVQFIARQFQERDRKFDALEARVARLEVLHEDHLHKTELLAEGLGDFNRRFEGFREEVAEGFAAIRAQIPSLN